MLNRHLPEYCLSSRPLRSVDGVVIHYFSARNVDPDNKFDPDCCLRLFKDLNRSKPDRQWYMKGSVWPDVRMYASAHVLIDREGVAYQLASFNRQCYHAGKSELQGRSHCNQWTVGIELIGSNQSGFTLEQYQSLATVIGDLQVVHTFDRQHIAGHDRVRWNAIRSYHGDHPPKYKYDPTGAKDGMGDNFEWPLLYRLMDERNTP